uniref:DUF4515 domain-containing protein n=1 Tax=Anolis carolinensis TaxID=28377 RepID=A0A803TBN7_ANOCA
MEEKFHKKAKEIGLIQIELKMIKEFRKKKDLMEKELEELKETLANTKKEHRETISMLERKFLEEKVQCFNYALVCMILLVHKE